MDLGKSALKALKPVLVAGLLAMGAAFASADFSKAMEGLDPRFFAVLPVLQWFVMALLDAHKHRNDTVVQTTITTPLGAPVAPGLPQATVVSTFTTPVDPAQVMPTSGLTEAQKKEAED